MSADKTQDSRRRVIFFDTTLRDGEQSPGATMTVSEKLQIAQQLARLRVDIIEAGFPYSSPGDFEAVKLISQNVHGPAIAGLCRASIGDIDRAWDALKFAQKGRIHTFIATSPIHMEKKLQKTPQQVVEMAIKAVSHAKCYTADVEFSAEDATRSEFDFLCEIIEKVIDAGATTINIPDTVGYAIPHEYGANIARIIAAVPNSSKAVFSVHCHNDLGLAVSNSIAALVNGATQVECAINGLGERAGNAAIEELIMAIHTRGEYLGLRSEAVSQEIHRSSRLVSRITGIDVQPNKAIVGRNAFAHEAGIHQDGVLKDKRTYEIMDAEAIGLAKSELVLGKHSGRHAFIEKLTEFGFELSATQVNKAFAKFKELCDKKKVVSDEDILSIVEDERLEFPEKYRIETVNVMCGGRVKSTSMIQMYRDEEVVEDSAIGVGPVDAVYKCIRQITGESPTLVNYSVKSVTDGIDALGEVTIHILDDENKKSYTGHGAELDIVEASAKAYINAINKMVFWRENTERKAAEKPEE